MSQLISTVARSFDRAGIPYMVIGGQAVLIHGESRFTHDIDVTIGVGPERSHDIMRIAQEAGWEVLPEAPEAFVEKTLVLPCRDQSTGMRIDIIFSFTPYEQTAIERAIRVRVDDIDVAFASVEDLIIHKLVAGRPRDLEDARGVILKNPASDWDYVRRWLKAFEETMNRSLVSVLDTLLSD